MTVLNTPTAPVLVAGGGIGGVAAALALARQGYAVKVLEQAPQLGEIGAGIQLGPQLGPAGVHQQRIGAQASQLGFANHVLCVRGEPQVQGQDVQLAQKFMPVGNKRHAIGLRRLLRAAAPVRQHLHAKGAANRACHFRWENVFVLRCNLPNFHYSTFHFT